MAPGCPAVMAGPDTSPAGGSDPSLLRGQLRSGKAYGWAPGEGKSLQASWGRWWSAGGQEEMGRKEGLPSKAHRLSLSLLGEGAALGMEMLGE